MDTATADVYSFCRVWERLSEQGECDALGGAEFSRVLEAWLAAGRPTPIVRFIRPQANWPADREG